MARRRQRKEIAWPRDLASIPILARLSVPRRLDCRKCRRSIAPGEAHFGVTYRGRYGVATSHLCRCCAAKYVDEVVTPNVLAKVEHGIAAVRNDHPNTCPLCEGTTPE